MVMGVAPALAQETRYRVELLVLTQLEQNEQPLERQDLPDYSAAVDFLTPAVEEDEVESMPGFEEEPVAEVAAETGGALPAEDSDGATAVVEKADIDPNRLENITEMSSIMQEAWRRLRLSGPFRPEQYLSWVQGSQEPFPTLRLHDLQVVMIDDPWAEVRATTAVQADEPVTAGEKITVFADAAGLDALSEENLANAAEMEGPRLPDPVYYYRLDGTASLKRSRFLHLDLDLQFREAVRDPSQPGGGSADRMPVHPSSFLVHELKQRRQVRTGRMEYFDGPVFGVLAYITEVAEESGDSLE